LKYVISLHAITLLPSSDRGLLRHNATLCYVVSVNCGRSLMSTSIRREDKLDSVKRTAPVVVYITSE